MRRALLVLVLLVLAMLLVHSSPRCRSNERLTYVTVEDGPDAGVWPICNELDVTP